MSSKTPEEPEDKSHNALQLFPHRQDHMPSAPGPYSSMNTVVLSPAPSDLPRAPLGSISPAALRPSEKDHVVPLGMSDTCLRSHSSQGAASNAAPADSPSTVTDSSRHPGAEHSDGDSEASPSHSQVSAKSKKKKRTRTLTTAPQAAALFALLARTQFPTTSEREVIGQAIGLSARKVQIWFQNQRQKQKKLANSLPSQSQAELATPAPLPLMNQPGFSAAHAARLNAASGLSDNQSLGVTGRFGTPMHDYGAVILHSPYAEETSGSSGSVLDVNPYQYSPSRGFSSRAHTRFKHSLGHPQLLEYTHSPSQYNMYPFSSEPLGTMTASSFAAQPWLSEDVQRGFDMTSLPHPPTDATSPHFRRFMPPPGLSASVPATQSLYNPHIPASSRPLSIQSGSAAQLVHSHDIPPTAGASAPPSQMTSLPFWRPAHQAHCGSLSCTTGSPQDTFLSTSSGHIPLPSLPESLNLGVYGSPHCNLVPVHSPYSRATTPYGSQAAGRSRGANVHSESPPMNRKRARPHEETVESKRLRQRTAGSLSPPASYSETAIPYSRDHQAMRARLPTHPPLFQGHITEPFSEAVSQLQK